MDRDNTKNKGVFTDICMDQETPGEFIGNQIAYCLADINITFKNCDYRLFPGHSLSILFGVSVFYHTLPAICTFVVGHWHLSDSPIQSVDYRP